jgi:hypothetical protein
LNATSFPEELIVPDTDLPQIISRRDAKAKGLKWYFTGTPCKYGHIAKRQVSNCGCVDCTAIATKLYHERNPGLRTELWRDWSSRQSTEYLRERNRHGAAIQRERHPDRVQARIDDYISRHPEYIKNRNQQSIDWMKAHPEKRAIYNAFRRAAANKPAWADREAIEDVYRNCPEGHTVDHIVPLKGLTIDGYPVSGLHVHWNLGYLPPSENFSKGRRMRPQDMAIAESAC